MSDVVRDWIYGDRAGDGGKAYNTKQIIRKREIFGSEAPRPKVGASKSLFFKHL